MILKIDFKHNFEHNFVLTKLRVTTRTQKEALLCWYYLDKRPKHFVVAQVIVQPKFLFCKEGIYSLHVIKNEKEKKKKICSSNHRKKYRLGEKWGVQTNNECGCDFNRVTRSDKSR